MLLDLQTELAIITAFDGLFAQIHSHAGTTGFEDLLLILVASLGDLKLKDTFAFAQPFGLTTLANGQKITVCYESAVGLGSCELLFVKKRVEALITIGGVTIGNLAIFEDVNFPSPGNTKPAGATYSSGDQAFGFGNVLTLKGRTEGGIALTAQTFLCAEAKGNRIKKHSWSKRVNPECATGGLSQGLFDLEKLSIGGVQLAAGLTAALSVVCGRSAGITCSFKNTLTFTEAPFFSSVKITTEFEEILGPRSFTGMTAKASSGPLSFTFYFDPLLRLKKVRALLGLTLNPEANPATLRLEAKLKSGEGLTLFRSTLNVRRAGLTLSLSSSWKGSAGTLSFSDLKMTAKAEAGAIRLQVSLIALATGLSGSIEGTVRF
jgi:hypothetical protein